MYEPNNPYNKKISEIKPINSGVEFGRTESVIAKDREDLRKIIEEPCLPSCLSLYDKNIYTRSSTANRTDKQAEIAIDYDSLDETNKKIVEQLVNNGIIEEPRLQSDPEHRGRMRVTITVPIAEDDTVGKVSDKFMQIISSFQQQDVMYGRYSIDSFDELIRIYGELLHPNANGEIEFEEFEDLVKTVNPDYVYDEETGEFWANEQLLYKHKKFIERDKEALSEKLDKDDPNL